MKRVRVASPVPQKSHNPHWLNDESSEDVLYTADGRNLAAVLLGRRGGLKGGKARAEALSAKRRQEIARKAAEARWRKK